MDDLFKPLLEFKPSADLKLLAAWDGLTIESQMRLLTTADEAGRHIPDEVAKKALASPNAYVRYLAGKRVRHRRDSPLADAAEKDADPLVQSSQFSAGLFDRYWSDPAKFWALPEASRFAYLGKAGDYFGPKPQDVVKLLDHALSSGVAGGEIEDMAVEYVETLRTVKTRRIYDKPLWEFLPRCPDLWLAGYLIRRLPDPKWISSELTRKLLERREKHFFWPFLDRSEHSFRRLRKAIIKSPELDLDPESRAEHLKEERLRLLQRLVSSFLISFGPLLVIGGLIVLAMAEAQVTSFVAAAAALVVLLKLSWAGFIGLLTRWHSGEKAVRATQEP